MSINCLSSTLVPCTSNLNISETLVFDYSVCLRLSYIYQTRQLSYFFPRCFSICSRQTLSPVCITGRDSSVGIATRYGLDGSEIESRFGARFSAPFQTGPGAHPASCTMGTGSFPGLKLPGRDVDHPPHLEGRVEICICSPSGPWWPVIG